MAYHYISIWPRHSCLCYIQLKVIVTHLKIQTPMMSSAIQPSTESLQSPGSFHLTTNQQVSTQCAGEPFSHGQTVYRLCGDNIDKTVKPRYMRSDTHKTESIHYFHSYAAANRVDFSDLSERTPHYQVWTCGNLLHPYYHLQMMMQ